MANNVERRVIEILGSILAVEEHLRSGTHGHDDGWSTATEGIRSAQREELLALRNKLARTLADMPAAGMQALERLLEHDPVVNRAFLRAQLAAADLGIDRVSLKKVPPARW